MRYKNVGHHKIGRLSFRMVFFAVPIIILSGLFVFGQGETEYAIVGRVGDGNGQPVVRAGVFLEPVRFRSTSFERFVEVELSAPDGRFRIIRNKKKSPLAKKRFFSF